MSQLDQMVLSRTNTIDLEGNRLHHTLTLSPEQFRALYLQPKIPGAGFHAYANPTPLGVSSFLLAHFPLAMDLLNFQGAVGASGLAGVGGMYACAGIGLYIAAIMAWSLGDTFTMVVFGTFGGFWTSYAMIISPSMGIAASYAPADLASNPIAAAAAGAMTREYNSGLAMYFLVWGILCFLYLIVSLRTNVPFVVIFLSLTVQFELLAAGYFHIGIGDTVRAAVEIKAAGACGFIVSLMGVWIDLHFMLEAVDFPFNVPLLDLSKVVKGRGDLRKPKTA